MLQFLVNLAPTQFPPVRDGLIRLLLDQGLPRTTGKLLSATACDVVHVGDMGLGRATRSKTDVRAP